MVVNWSAPLIINYSSCLNLTNSILYNMCIQRLCVYMYQVHIIIIIIIIIIIKGYNHFT